MLEIYRHNDFKKDYNSLNKNIKDAFIERFTEFQNNPRLPHLNVHKIHPKYKNLKSFNVTGDYRVIFKEENGKIILFAIGTHSKLYK